MRSQRIMILHDYLEILSVLEDLPRTFSSFNARGRFSSFDARIIFLRGKLPEIRRRIISPYKGDEVEDRILCSRLPKKTLAIRLTGRFYRLGSSSIRLSLTPMRKLFPECFRHGYELGSIDLEGIAKSIKSGAATIGLFDNPSILRWINIVIEREALRGFFPK